MTLLANMCVVEYHFYPCFIFVEKIKYHVYLPLLGTVVLTLLPVCACVLCEQPSKLKLTMIENVPVMLLKKRNVFSHDCDLICQDVKYSFASSKDQAIKE